MNAGLMCVTTETSVAADYEILLIQKLREICGCDFVSKLQKMIKDKALSKVFGNPFNWLWKQPISC